MRKESKALLDGIITEDLALRKAGSYFLKSILPKGKEAEITFELKKMSVDLVGMAPAASLWIDSVVKNIEEDVLAVMKEQQIRLHPLVNAIDLVINSMASMSVEVKVGLLGGIEDLPQHLQNLPWVEKVHSAYLELKKGNEQTETFRALLQEGKKDNVLPEGYLV